MLFFEVFHSRVWEELVGDMVLNGGGKVDALLESECKAVGRAVEGV